MHSSMVRRLCKSEGTIDTTRSRKRQELRRASDARFESWGSGSAGLAQHPATGDPAGSSPPTPRAQHRSLSALGPRQKPSPTCGSSGAITPTCPRLSSKGFFFLILCKFFFNFFLVLQTFTNVLPPCVPTPVGAQIRTGRDGGGDYLVPFPLVSTSALFTWKLDKGFKVWSVFQKKKKLLKVSRSTSMIMLLIQELFFHFLNFQV